MVKERLEEAMMKKRFEQIGITVFVLITIFSIFLANLVVNVQGMIQIEISASKIFTKTMAEQLVEFTGASTAVPDIPRVVVGVLLVVELGVIVLRG